MLRQIKFRCWDKKCKQEDLQMFSWEEMKDTQMNDFFSNHNKRYELMQYTGLKDKNGVEVYEGDIIHWKSDIKNEYIGNFKVEEDVIVEWNKEELKWVVREKGANVFDELVDLIGYDFEVIGNIYTTPELLKEGE
jgi:uncharacterized phage protein (TIGR01671 family)